MKELKFRQVSIIIYLKFVPRRNYCVAPRKKFCGTSSETGVPSRFAPE